MTSKPASPVLAFQSEHHENAEQLQEQMQRMIALQTEQQRQYATDNSAHLSTVVTKTFASPEVPIVSNISNTTSSTRATVISATSESDTNSYSALGLPDANVGQGTLIWKGGEKQKKQEVTNVTASNQQSALPRNAHAQQQHQKLQHQEDWNDQQQENAPKLTSHLGVGIKQVVKSIQGGLASYGGVDEQTPLHPDVKPLPPGHHLLDHHQVHDYHYGPDYGSHDDSSMQRQRGIGQNSLLSQFCCCIWNPLVHCLDEFIHAETLHRSFCYGAIDGMLTGAGIVSTFCGMNMLRLGALNTYSSEIRALVVVFTAATCFADSVCMALGHVWTTHVLAAAQARERSEARIQLMNHKADAKGMLVDMLLQKGMLKIDAMSIADTLDGYPDLFASALIGDSITGTSPHHRQQQHFASSVSYDNEERLYGGVYSIPGTDIAVSDNDESIRYVSGTQGESHQRQQHRDQEIHLRATSSQQQNQWRGYASYGHLTDFEMDHPDSAVTIANKESRKESFFMMMGFSLFAVIPSLIYTLVPTLMNGMHVDSPADFGDGFSSGPSVSASSSSVINPNSLAISLTACIMWCLGVWKSRFLDSNWLVFGVETVSVLLVCILCAYWLGALLNHLFLPNEYQITVITPSVSPSSASDIIASHMKKVLPDTSVDD